MDSSSIARAWKAVVAVLGAIVIIGNQVATVVVDGYGDGAWTAEDTLTTGLALLTALGVYLKANQTKPTATDGTLFVKQEEAEGETLFEITNLEIDSEKALSQRQIVLELKNPS